MRERVVAPPDNGANRGRSRFWTMVPLWTMALLCTLPAVTLITGPGTCLEEGSTRSEPTGYYNIGEIMDLYPSIVIQNGTSFDIVSSLSLPATRPFYLGPGDVLRFSKGVYLNLTAPPVIQGSPGTMVELVPRIDGELWGGINIIEADPSTSPEISHLELKEAVIGISTSGSDLEITGSVIADCERSGIESRGPLTQGTRISISTTEIIGSGYYGIHLQKIDNSVIDNVSIKECGTGIRAFESELDLEDSSILDSTSLGIVLVNSISDVRRTSANVSEGSVSAAQNQVTLVNSTCKIQDTNISGGKNPISVLTGSSLDLRGSLVSGSITDCVQTLGSEIYFEGVQISGAGESGIHLDSSSMRMKDSTLMYNGEGTGTVVFSSIFMKDSTLEMEGGSISGSGDAHIHLVGSYSKVSNASLGTFGNHPVILDHSSTAEYVNVQAPSSARFLDIFSRTKHSITTEFVVKDYIDGEPIKDVEIDITNREGIQVGSVRTDDLGRTIPLLLLVYSNTSSGTFSHLPFQVAAVKDDYEVSLASIEMDLMELMIEMFPPNSPPSLNVIAPVNGTSVEGDVEVQGYIRDDLDVLRIRYRVDSGTYRTVVLENVEENGYFSIELEVSGISKGEHQLWIHAFDGSHLSSPSIRSIIKETSGLDDSDSDGIPDIFEDRDGNGEVGQNETDPNDPDTDDDGLLDGIELDDSDGSSTDPLDPDTDQDFILDGTEDANRNGRVDANETDPNLEDTDGDGYSDLDDRYPLDQTRWKEPDPGNRSATTTLILIVIIGVLIIIILYALYLRFGDNVKAGSGEDEEVRNSRKLDERGPTTKRMVSRERGPGPRRVGERRRGQDRIKGRP